MNQTLQIGVMSEPPSIEVKKLVPVPEIHCAVNEDPKKIRENIKENIQRPINIEMLCKQRHGGKASRLVLQTDFQSPWFSLIP